MDLITWGAFAFGLVVGWLTYFIVRRAKPNALTDLASIIGTLGGAAVLNLFDAKGPLFGAYAIGLAVGFIAYFVIFWCIVGKAAIRESLLNTKDGATVMD